MGHAQQPRRRGEHCGVARRLAFHGEIDLHAWLTGRRIGAIVLAGIQTNMCVETTARVGGNLGYRVTVALDATRTFDLTGPDGSTLSADELTRATATNLHGGGFAQIATTTQILAELSGLDAHGTENRHP
ncbi:MAG TPA: isochorismatase family protein [Dermatophilaceae bacterium]